MFISGTKRFSVSFNTITNMSVQPLTLTRREQARKASEMQPQLSSEAERMLMKLRVSGFNT